MSSEFDAICGITQEELYYYFKEPIEELSVIKKCSVEEIKDLLKEKYDGYHFSENISKDIYNPFSIINALKSKKLENYWYKTGTPAYLVNLLEGSNINIKSILEESYAPEYFVDYRTDKEDPLAMLYQSGYITIKGYDSRRNLYKLDFPNEEVSVSFLSLIGNSYFKNKKENLQS